MEILPLTAAIFIALSGVCYLTLQLLLLVGLGKTAPPVSAPQESVSIIIAARNEQTSLPFLLERLLQQTCPVKEIILINDRSTDGTLAVMEGYRTRDQRIQIITIPESDVTRSPKKHALNAGIARSTGRILCFTDADCLPEPTWVEGMLRYFDDATGFVTGPVLYQHAKGSRFQFFLDYEEIKKAIFTAGSIGWDYAWLAKGGNMAYRREVFDQIGGFRAIEHSLGGDDDLLVQLVQQRTTWKVRYAFSPECRVTTAPTATAAAFLRQRRRHVSASVYYPLLLKTALTGYHFSNWMLTTGTIIAALHPLTLFTALCFLALKVIVDLQQLRTIGLRLKLRYPLRFYPAAELLFMLYHTLIAPIGLLGKITWRKD